jgi:hypothetical protein
MSIDWHYAKMPEEMLEERDEEIEQLRERLRLQEMGARSLVDILENEIQQLRGGRTTSGASGRCLAMSNDSKGRGQIATPLPGRMEHAGMSDVVVWLRRVAEGTAGVLYAESGDDGVKVREMWHPTDLFPVADEIERLRKATKKQANMIVDQEAEIEQLRKLVGDAANEQVEYLDKNSALEAAVKRLQDRIVAMERGYKTLRDGAEEEVVELRKLLREAADAERDYYATQVSVLMKSGWYKRIREALGDE